MDDSPAPQEKVNQPPILFARTQAVVRQLEQELGGVLISYWNSHIGAVCHNDVLALYDILENLGQQDTIFLFVKSDGGHGQAALRFVNLLRQHCRRLVALAPLQCASAATMITLGADQILMGPMSYLTAVDTSLTHDLSPIDRDNDRVSVSLDELKRALRLMRGERAENPGDAYETLFKYVHPLVVGAVDRADSLSIMLCKELLSYHIEDQNRVDAIAETLNAKYPSHNYPILFEEARRIGLDVDHLPGKANTLLLQLNELYSEMGQRARTDFSENRSHSNEIINILEAAGSQVYFQQDKDWFYRAEERRWIVMNDESSWRKNEFGADAGDIRQSVLHMR
ncbi:MAG: hypothetical protein OSA97_03495 [Nevskia sp.]|nr:hypothetical protein [Nevskia sp.]